MIRFPLVEEPAVNQDPSQEELDLILEEMPLELRQRKAFSANPNPWHTAALFLITVKNPSYTALLKTGYLDTITSDPHEQALVDKNIERWLNATIDLEERLLVLAWIMSLTLKNPPTFTD